MENKLEKKYGFATAVCMVVGIVIGSGVFFKAEVVLSATGGNMPMGILAWLIVGVIMAICSYVFAIMATRYEKVNGLVDYAEATVGERYAYNVGWFMATIYNPGLVSVLAWLSARYTCVLLGWDIVGGSCMTIACFYLCLDFVINAISPKLAGRFQISATVIKLVPLILMAVVGTIAGLTSGRLGENIATGSLVGASGSTGLMASVVAVAFAYEGWILTTSINAELRNAKKTLPRALITGSLIVVAVYILYYIGLHGAVTTTELMASGETGAKMAFQRIFGSIGGTGLFVLVVISCLGTLNGLTMANCRSFYALAARGRGPGAKTLGSLDDSTNMPTNSAVISLAFSAFWLLYFYGANLAGGWFAPFIFDSAELPIITLYGMYIPMFVQMLRKEKQLGGFKRFVMPALGIVCCVFMVYAAFAAHGAAVWYYLIAFVVFMVIGNLFYNKR